MAKDDVEIEVEAAPEVAEDNIKVEIAPEAPKRKAVKTEEGIESLRAQLEQRDSDLEQERAARSTAEKRAQEASQSAFTAQNEALDSNFHLVTNAISTIAQTNDILKSNYRDAMSVGDFERAADIQSEMSSNAAKLLQLEQGKQAIERAPRPQAPQPYIADRLQSVVNSLAETAPRSANWVRSHPEYARDDRLFQKMMSAHQLAVSDGIVPETDEYFAEIESILRIRRSDSSEDYSDPSRTAAQVTQRRSAPPAAPVSRSGTAPGTRPNTVRLTREQAEMAEMMGMTPQEYAKNMLLLQKEGKMN